MVVRSCKVREKKGILYFRVCDRMSWRLVGCQDVCSGDQAVWRWVTSRAWPRMDDGTGTGWEGGGLREIERIHQQQTQRTEDVTRQAGPGRASGGAVSMMHHPWIPYPTCITAHIQSSLTTPYTPSVPGHSAVQGRARAQAQAQAHNASPHHRITA